MTFLAPLFLVGLAAVPILAAIYVLVQRRRGRYAVRFTNLDLLANLVPRTPAWRRHVPAVFYLASTAFLVLALARPQMTMAVPRDDATIILTMDVSGSMLAEDVEPSRLEAAQAAAHQFLDTVPDGVRIGVVAFADHPYVLAPATRDRELLGRAIDSLTAEGGTAMGDAMARALEISGALTTATLQPGETPPAAPGASDDPRANGDPGATGDRAPSPSSDAGAVPPGTAGDPSNAPEDPLVAMVLLSDGSNTTGQEQPLDVADQAATAGVPIYAVALGTDAGEVEVRDGFGVLRTVSVPPDPATLREIAETTGGRFYDAPTGDQLAQIYESLGSRIGFVWEVQEVTWLFAAIGLALIVAGAGLAAFWFNRFP